MGAATGQAADVDVPSSIAARVYLGGAQLQL
jgi:hypothetical protein